MKRIGNSIYFQVTADRYSLFDTITGLQYILSKECIRELKNLYSTGKLHKTTQESLAFLAFVKENNLLSTSKNPIIEEPNVLGVWLHLTNMCNLRCSYCYIHKSNESMDEKILNKCIRESFKKAKIHNYQTIAFKLSGGEPTLVLGLIKYAVKLINQLSIKNSINSEITILSNGLLINSEVIELIKNNQLKIMISFDGLQKSQDLYRKTVGGKGSFNIVKQSLIKLKAENIDPFISVTVTQKSSQDLAGLLEYLYSIGLYNVSLNFVRWFNDKKSEKQFINNILAAYKIVEKHICEEMNLNGLIDRVTFFAPHKQICGAGKNYLVFDHKGKQRLCHMLISVTDKEKLKKANTKILEATRLNGKCENCLWKYWCSNGCPLIRNNNINPNCNIYRRLIPKVLLLNAEKEYSLEQSLKLSVVKV